MPLNDSQATTTKQLRAHLLGPYQTREIFAHGLKWEPDDNRLPMSLSVSRGVQILVGVFFLPFCVLLAMFGILILGFALPKVDVTLVFVGIGFIATSLIGFKYSLARLLSQSTLTIREQEVEHVSRYPWKNVSWTEPLRNYKGVGAKLSPATRYNPPLWQIVLLHTNRSRSLPLKRVVVTYDKDNTEVRDREVLPEARRYAALLGVPMMGTID